VPVQKFRDFAEADRALACDPNDPRLTRRIRRLWEFARRLTSPPPFPRGVHKYRSLEEADAARHRWEGEHVRRLARERTKGGSSDTEQRVQGDDSTSRFRFP
jgi:hypothetical protein